METINDRIEILINKHFNGNKAAFANAIDMPPTSMSSYFGVKRRSKPSVDMLAKIVKLLDADARWLLTGEETEKCSHRISTQGDFSPASIHGDAINGGIDVAVLQEKIKSLEALIAEKERLINVLMEERK